MGSNQVYFRKVAIIGVGLIGGSLGMTIKNKRMSREVAGISLRHTSLVTALKSHAIDRAYHDMKKVLLDADLVILATPVNTIINILAMMGPFLKRGCIVTDVGSTKLTIVETAEKKLPNHCSFVGGHPLAGSEKQGAMFANPDLFGNAICLLTPTEKTNRSAYDKIKNFWTQLGSKVVSVSPAEHDKILAYISHLPHLLAYALMGVIPQNCLNYAAQGLKDATRVAASSPNMWNDICMANSKNLVQALDEMVKQLAAFRKMIVFKDENSLIEQFKKSKAKRDGLDKSE